MMVSSLEQTGQADPESVEEKLQISSAAEEAELGRDITPPEEPEYSEFSPPPISVTAALLMDLVLGLIMSPLASIGGQVQVKSFSFCISFSSENLEENAGEGLQPQIPEL